MDGWCVRVCLSVCYPPLATAARSRSPTPAFDSTCLRGHVAPTFPTVQPAGRGMSCGSAIIVILSCRSFFSSPTILTAEHNTDGRPATHPHPHHPLQQSRPWGRDVASTFNKGAITSKIKHAIKLKTSPARLAQLLQPSLGFCFSLQPMTAYRPVCASLAGLVLCFIACFILLVIAP